MKTCTEGRKCEETHEEDQCFTQSRQKKVKPVNMLILDF